MVLVNTIQRITKIGQFCNRENVDQFQHHLWKSVFPFSNNNVSLCLFHDSFMFQNCYYKINVIILWAVVLENVMFYEEISNYFLVKYNFESFMIIFRVNVWTMHFISENCHLFEFNSPCSIRKHSLVYNSKMVRR